MILIRNFWRRQVASLITAVVFLCSYAISQDVSNRAAEVEREAAALSLSADKQDRIAAAAKYDQAIKLYHEAGNKTKAAHLYNVLGIAWMNLGDYAKRIAAYESALNLYRSIGDSNGEALGLLNIGDSYSEAGEHEKALEYLNLAIPVFRAAGNKLFESTANWSIAEIYKKLGMPEKALEYYTAAEKISPSANGLLTIAFTFDDLSRFKDALLYYRRAEKIQIKAKDLYGLSKTYGGLGIHFVLQGKYKTAILYFERALQLNKQLPNTYSARYAAASLTTDIGIVKFRNGQLAAAADLFTKAREIFRAAGDKAGEARTIHWLVTVFSKQSRFAEAQQLLFDEVALRRINGDRRGEATALDSLRDVISRGGNASLAISFGKRAVNEFQALRAAIKGLSREVQSAYLGTVESAYRELAELLVSEGRLAEAQAVLEMLKEEEAFDFARRDASETDKLSKRADLRDDERKALERYDQLATQLASLGEEFSRLKDKKAALNGDQALGSEDQKRFDQITADLENANMVFQVFLRSLSEEVSKKPAVVNEIQENAGLQADLKSWGDGVVSLYTIVGDDRYRVILTTASIQTDGKFDIKATDLNRKIADFRAAVQNPRSDPRPLGKELYDIIVKPIEKQIEGADAKTLLWSLDGALRYLPIAALWDGKQYFGQKYQNVLITLASRSRLSDEPTTDWRMLALGVTAAKQLTEPNGTRLVNFSALPSVRNELGSIVREEQSPDDTGVISGKQLIDEEFNERSLKDRLANRFKVVHIASHFSFRPGDMTRSFLLLGDGSALTLDKFKTSPQLKFSGVELLTLSACDTAVGEPDANGKEVESFAVIAQQNGAKAVMATLWPVADESTAEFMTNFYKIKTGQATSKAEAVRQVQKAMIEGRIKSNGAAGGCRADDFGGGGKTSVFKCDPNAPFSHPYFWSPFVLIGNWR